MATYRVSTGAERTTCLINSVLLPEPGEREVHDNGSFTGDYVLRAAAYAAAAGDAVAILRSHPRGHGWQPMSPHDADAEPSYAHLVHPLTHLPLLGMTIAGDDTWFTRAWLDSGESTAAESVRVVGGNLQIAWNDDQRPIPLPQPSQVRTISAWGETQQADLPRLRVLVVGLGSVGLDVAVRLAATGIEHLGVMDFDIIETLNRDRLIGASAANADGHRKKVDLARELSLRAATAANPTIHSHDLSICSSEGQAIALGYDVIFSCVDRPWPRAELPRLHRPHPSHRRRHRHRRLRRRHRNVQRHLANPRAPTWPTLHGVQWATRPRDSHPRPARFAGRSTPDRERDRHG